MKRFHKSDEKISQIIHVRQNIMQFFEWILVVFLKILYNTSVGTIRNNTAKLK